MNLFLIIFSAVLVLCSLLSLVKHDYWTFRVFDYPRLQLLLLSVICLVLLVIYFESSALHWGLTTTMSLHVCYLFSLIFPFTILSRKQVMETRQDLPDQSISLMISNVFEDNTNSKGCLAEVRKADPDVLLLLETNDRWDQETRELEQHYAHHIRVPMENTYGMLMYSKLPLTDSSVEFMVEDDSALMALRQYELSKNDLLSFVAASSHVKRLQRLGIQKDIAYCLQHDLYDVLPVMRGNTLVKM